MPKTALPKKNDEQDNFKRTGYAKYTQGRGVRWDEADTSLRPTDYVTKREARAKVGSKPQDRAEDVAWNSEYKAAKNYSAYLQRKKKQKKESSKTTAMANGRRTK